MPNNNIKRQIQEHEAAIQRMEQHNSILNRTGDAPQNLKAIRQMRAELGSLYQQARGQSPAPKEKPDPSLSDPATFAAKFAQGRAQGPVTGQRPATPALDMVNSWMNGGSKPVKKPAPELSDQHEFAKTFAEARNRVLAEKAREAPRLKNLNKVQPNPNGKGYTTTVMVAGHPREVAFDQVPNDADIRKVKEKILAQDHPELFAKYQAVKSAKGKMDPGNRMTMITNILRNGKSVGTEESESTDPVLWNQVVNKTWDNFQTDMDNASKILKPLHTGRRYLADKIHPYAVNAGNFVREHGGGIGGDVVTGVLDTLNGNGMKYITDPGSMAGTMGEGIDEGGFDGYKKFAWAPMEAVLAIDEITGLPTLLKGTAKAVGKGVAKLSPNTYYKIAPKLFPTMLKDEASVVAANQALKRMKSTTIEVPRSKISVSKTELESSGLNTRQLKKRKQLEMQNAYQKQLNENIKIAEEAKTARLGHEAHESYEDIEEHTKVWLHSWGKAYEQKLHREEAGSGHGH